MFKGWFKTKMNKMHQVDFTLGPISLDQIEPNLYLGGLSAAKNEPTLKKHNITHILTIDTCPLPRKIVEMKSIKTKFIQLSDQPHEDLLSHFEDSYDFISEGVEKGAVLIHCYFGVSRSATVTIAYIMKKYQIPFSAASDKVKAKRGLISPNHGFVSQLLIYQDMGFKLDNNNVKFKKFRLRIAASQVRKVHILPQEFMGLIKPDPGITQCNPEPNVYRCKKCRRVLASESNLLTHTDNRETCRQTYFVEPLEWMKVTANPQGKIYCPQCYAKLGSYSWILGCQCPCGAHVAPAFYLKPSKVDYSNVVKNVEMTF